MRQDKDTYNMAVKQRCRKFIRKFIAKNLRKKPEQTKVLCFPGEECLEIYAIYDKLGVPRKNVVCLERDQDVFNRLVAKKTGCEVINQDLSTFVSQSSHRFDVISLDFMGQLSTHEEDIYQIVKRGLLADSAIVFTNFCGARETAATKSEYIRSLTREGSLANFGSMWADLKEPENDESTEKILNAFTENIKENGLSIINKDLKTLRDEGIWMGVHRSLVGGTAGLIHDLLFKETDADALSAETEKQFMESNIGEHDEKFRNYLEGAKKLQGKKTDMVSHFASAIAKDYLKATLCEMIMDNPCMELAPYKDDPEILRMVCFREGSGTPVWHVAPAEFGIKALSQALYEYFHNGHDCLASDSFRYIGSNGMPMMADLFYLKNRHAFDFMKSYVDESASSLCQLLKPLTSNPARIGALLGKIKAAILSGSHFISEPPGRIFLGNESDVHATVQVLPDRLKEKYARKMLKQNPEAEDDKIAFLTGASLSQIEAWRSQPA